MPDFWNLDPIGSIYTNALNVVDQDAPGAVGIPGVSRSVSGSAWITTASSTSPSPANISSISSPTTVRRLEIDNQQIIE
jgi:hypothetical protein